MTEEFAFEFFNTTDVEDEELRQMAEDRLRALTKGHKDLTGAAVSLEPMSGDTTPHLFRARVVVYIRPENIAATEKSDSERGALKGALDAVEKQVRDKRERLGNRWSQP